ncbi:MAG TPA: PQQ-binding-like beta-propeller repeat protein [Elusimicrobiales bacterium]|nr:PQQ-binding-like beta-propeller repeat protein [Elusimicrobiales bacterium]
MRTIVKLILAGLVAAGANSAASAENAPQKLFHIENDKRVGNFSLLQDDSIIAIRERTRLWSYDGNTGAKLWETKVKGGVDDGMHLVWNDKLYLMPLKKGMVAFDVNTGKQVWETKLDVKMKDFYKSYSYKDNFLLEFEKDMISLNPDTGEVAWRTSDMEYSKAAGKAGAQRLYYISKDWGSRILLLGKKGPSLIDAKTGKVLWKSEHDFSDEIEKPVLFTSAGQEAALLLYEEGASSIDLKTGQEAWFIKDEFEDATGLVQFEKDGGKYCLFAFGKELVMFDALSGKILWRTGKDSDLKGRPYMVQADGGNLLILTTRNLGTKGGLLTLFRASFDTGGVAWKRDLAFSKQMHMNFKIPIFGIRMRNSGIWYRDPIKTPNGLLFQTWGTATRKLDDKGEPGEKEGEGLIMVNPETGDVVWRSYFKVFDTVSADAQKILAGESEAGIAGKGRNAMSANDVGYQNMIPAPVITGDVVYAMGNEGVLKLELATGKTLWESPKYGYVSKIMVDNGVVYGFQGSASWAYTADAKKEKADDVIIQSKKQGYFSLDAASGKELWNIKSSKKPYSIFNAIVGKDGKDLFLCDGRYLRRLDLTPATKGFAWELDLKKSDIGEIGAEEGVVFKERGTTFSNYGSYTEKTTSYDVSMQHGAWQLANGDLLVIAAEGPARISADGKIKWKTEWDWKRNKINFTPTRLQADKYLVYQYKKKIFCLDLETGEIKWMTKEAKNSEIEFDAKEQKMFIVDDDEVSAYAI